MRELKSHKGEVQMTKREEIWGGLLWLSLVGANLLGWTHLALAELLIALAPLVIVPLGRRLAFPRDGFEVLGWFCGTLAVSAFLLPPGWTGALLTLPWLMRTGALGWVALRNLYTRSHDLPGVCSSMALIYLPVGAGWLFLAQFNTPIGPFPAIIVLLTAAHFHYAGFATLLLVGLSGRHLNQSFLYRASGIAIVVGPAVVALGISTVPTLEALGGTLLATAVMLWAFWGMSRLGQLTSVIARLFLFFSWASLLISMPMAVLYALGQTSLLSPPGIPTMIHLHGVLNVLGFTLLGMLGWRIELHFRAKKRP